MENSVARKSLRGEEEDSDEDSDKTMGVLGQIMGSWGPWQSNVFLFDLSIQAIATAQTMSIAFTAPTMDFVCVDPIDGHSPLNATQDQCHYYSINGHLEPCTRWTYSKEKFDSTVTSEFDIVCDKAYLASVAQSLYIFGYFVSSLVSGYLSDKYGRIPRPMVVSHP
ncbi:Solute carrier family 22 member 8 [Halotydeus destructor]|nr:Solute carrier family 22 member 8 [Halotydeus destructor]